MKKVALFVVILFTVFAMPFFTAADQSSDLNDIYEYSGADKIKDSLDNKTKDFLGGENSSLRDFAWVNSLKTENVFYHIYGFLKDGAKTPLKAGFTVLGIILISAAFNAFKKQGESEIYVNFAVTLAIISAVIAGVWSSINSAINTVRGSSTFMLAFVPVYAGILSLSGAPATAAVSGGMLLSAAEFISTATAFGLTAIMGSYLALSIGCAVSPFLNGSGIADLFKKIGTWTMSLCTTVFLGVLGIQTAANSAADSLTAKTAKFILGTCIPVAGTALSGAVTTVSASVSLLKSSVGIYGIAAMVIMFLPIVLELLMWRAVICISGGVCNVFSMDGTSKTLKAVDSMLSLLIGALLLIEAMFVISLSLTVSSGRAL